MMKLIKLVCWLMLFASFNGSALEHSIEDESDWGLEKDAEGSLYSKDAEGSSRKEAGGLPSKDAEGSLHKKDAEGSRYTKDAEGSPHQSAEGSASILERMHAIEDVDPKAYGVRRGCVSLSRIKHIRFQDDQNAIIDLGRGKKLLLRLHRECTGIKDKGFEYESRSGQLCAKFAYFNVIGRSMHCTLESITPYVNIEDIKPQEK
ncbi:hypothetical protein N9J88_07335 [Porticoccaceae bacterium]|nr:hypothetical protein [Porticoccaceae bacterium]